jgi:hypothetical protein
MTAGHGVKPMKPVQESTKRRREIAGRIRAAGERARAEAEARRAEAAKHPAGLKPAEIGGAKGPEPTRYGDWEKKGLISDF